jgi:hypothetical protein
MSLVPYKSYSSLWTAIRRGEFPAARRFGGKSGWFEDEVAECLANLRVVQLMELRPHEVRIRDRRGRERRRGDQ